MMLEDPYVGRNFDSIFYINHSFEWLKYKIYFQDTFLNYEILLSLGTVSSAIQRSAAVQVRDTKNA